MGVAEAGHYYSFINVVGEKWIELNDSVVRGFDLKGLESEAFGGGSAGEFDEMNWEGKENAKSAYMLIYERKMKFPFELHVQSKIEHESLKEIVKFTPEKEEESSIYPMKLHVNYYDMDSYIPSEFDQVSLPTPPPSSPPLFPPPSPPPFPPPSSSLLSSPLSSLLLLLFSYF